MKTGMADQSWPIETVSHRKMPEERNFAIPHCLRDLLQWVAWKYVERAGTRTKCPINPRFGWNASSKQADRRSWIPDQALLDERTGGSEGFVILEFPYPSRIEPASSRREIRECLAKPPFGAKLAEFGQCGKQFGPSRVGRFHSISPTAGKWPTEQLRLPVTSAGIDSPGRCFAARVARVTPS